MNYNIDDQFLKKLLTDSSRSTVGRLCKQADILLAKLDPNSEGYDKLKILKEFNRELVYEIFRDLFNHIKSYQSGQKLIKFNLYSPNDKKSS